MGKSSKTLAALYAGDPENLAVGRMELFLQAFHANPEGLALSDEQGRILYRNAPFESVIRQGILTQDLSAFIGPVEYARTVSTVQVEILLSPFQKLSRIGLDATPGGAAYLWIIHVHNAASDSQQLRTIKKLYQAFVDNTFELVLRTSGNDALLFANPRFSRSLVLPGFPKRRV